MSILTPKKQNEELKTKNKKKLNETITAHTISSYCISRQTNLPLSNICLRDLRHPLANVLCPCVTRTTTSSILSLIFFPRHSSTLIHLLRFPHSQPWCRLPTCEESTKMPSGEFMTQYFGFTPEQSVEQ